MFSTAILFFAWYNSRKLVHCIFLLVIIIFLLVIMKNKFLVIAGVLAVILVVVNVFASGTLSGIGAGSQQAATLSALPNPIKYWQFESSSTPNNATYGTDKFSTVKGSGQSVIDWVNNTGCGRGSSNQGCGKITFNSLPDGNSISSFSSPNF